MQGLAVVLSRSIEGHGIRRSIGCRQVVVSGRGEVACAEEMLGEHVWLRPPRRLQGQRQAMVTVPANVGVERRHQGLADPVVVDLHCDRVAGSPRTHQPCAAKEGEDARIPTRQIGSRERVGLEQRLA